MGKHVMARLVAFVAFLSASGMFAARAGAQTGGQQEQTWEYGYSYLRLSIDGKNVSNFVHDPKYAGWLTVEDVEIANRVAGKPQYVESDKPSGEHPSGDPNWWEFSVALKPGRHGPGKMDFGSGDDGGFGPVIEAMKKKTAIPEAELDFYNIDHDTFIGKYKIKGIRVLSLDDVKASACPMYEVVLSFQSIEKE
jgi:hypothetical protein